MKNILITGGGGYIGSHAVKKFLDNKYNVSVLDNFTTGYREPLDILGQKTKFNIYDVDLKDEKKVDKVFKNNKFDAVVHFAALCQFNDSMQNPGKYFKNNVLGTLNILEAMVKNNVKFLVFSSTCATYGETQYLPVDENHPQNPENPYGESKLLTERIIKWYGKLYDLKYVILRYFNVCGCEEAGLIGDSKRPSSLLVQNAVRSVLGIQNFELTCSKFKTPDGTPVRDYVDVLDLIDAHFLALDYLKKENKSEIINIGTGKGSSVLEIVKTVEKVMKTKIKISKGETRKGEYAEIYANYDKAKKLLGWKPKRTLSDSVKSLEKWYRNKPEGYKY